MHKQCRRNAGYGESASKVRQTDNLPDLEAALAESSEGVPRCQVLYPCHEGFHLGAKGFTSFSYNNFVKIHL